MTWPESKPVQGDLVSDLGSVLRSHKTEFRAGLEKHFYWTDNSNSSAGEPRLSDGSFGPGSARAFYGTASEVSAFRDGSLMVTSDTSRLFGLTSGASVLLGSSRAIVSDGSAIAAVPGSRRLIQSGLTFASLGDSGHSFPTAYSSVPPSMLIQRIVDGDAGFDLGRRVSIAQIGTSSFTLRVENAGGASAMTILWRSDGTRSL